MNYPLAEGTRISIKLWNSKIYEGDLAYFTERSIKIINASRCTNEKSTVSNTFKFGWALIESIECLIDDLPRKTTKECFILPRSQYISLLTIINHTVYVPFMNTFYNRALEDLVESNLIGIAGVYNSENPKKLTAIATSTTDNAYIFHIALFPRKAIPKDLKLILQSKIIKKVVHDAEVLTTCLLEDGVELQNIYDTQQVHALSTCIACAKWQLKNRLDLGECLKLYFNIPKPVKYREVAMDTMLKGLLSGSQLQDAAWNVGCLIMLKSRQEDILQVHKTNMQVDLPDESGNHILATPMLH